MSPTTTPAAPTDALERRYSGADAISVVLTPDRAAGRVAVGTLRPGVVYAVAPAEAVRLVDVKGFQYATAGDAERAATYIEQRNAAALDPAAAATAAGEGGGIPVTADEE